MEIKLHHDKNWLSEKYLVEKLSADDIGKISGCCGPIVLKWLRKHNIPVRKASDPYFKPPLKRVWRKYKNMEWLKEHYVDKKLSTLNIAEMIGRETGEKIDPGSITKWMERFGIKRDNREKRVYTKERHHNWSGGRYLNKSMGTWLLNIDSKVIVEYRYIVENILGRKLSESETVHHINGDRADNRIENLYLFKTESEHQQYHQLLSRFILSNLNKDFISTKEVGLIKTSNLLFVNEK